MSIGARFLAVAGVLLIAAAVGVVAYHEWWGGDSDGVDRSCYPVLFSSGVVFIVASRLRPRRTPDARRSRAAPGDDEGHGIVAFRGGGKRRRRALRP